MSYSDVSEYMKRYRDYAAGDREIEDYEVEFQNLIPKDNDPQFSGKQGAGILAIAQDTGNILVCFRSANVRTDPNTWGVVGGKLEEGEGPREAAVREFEEETGYSGPITLLTLYVFEKGDFRYTTYVGLIPEQFEEFRPDEESAWENEYFHWATFEEVREKADKHFGLTLILRDGDAFTKLRNLHKKYSR